MDQIKLAPVIAELVWHNVRDSALTEDELRRYLEAYHRARLADPPDAPALTELAMTPVEPGPTDRPGNDSAHGAKSLATRKKNVLDAIDRHRAAGVSLQDVADAGRGLTLTDVMDAVEHKVLPLPKWAALEKAVAALDKRAADAAAEGQA